jgi:hypothetical protein
MWSLFRWCRCLISLRHLRSAHYELSFNARTQHVLVREPVRARESHGEKAFSAMFFSQSITMDDKALRNKARFVMKLHW